MGKATRSESEKRRRCILAKCPEFGSGNPKCAVCTGPVAVRDGGSWIFGRARSCHGCPMDGLGLAVCWACCPGPNTGFSTDGQSIVSADAAESKDELMAHEAERRWMAERNDMEEARKTGCGRASSPAAEEPALNAVRKALRFPSAEWEPIRRMVNGGDMTAAADSIGVARHLLTRADSPVRRIVEKLAEVGGSDWDMLRLRMVDATTTDAGAMLGVTKQAASKRDIALRARFGWYDRFVRSLTNAKLPFYVPDGVITPRAANIPDGTPGGRRLGIEQRPPAYARGTGSLSHRHSPCQD